MTTSLVIGKLDAARRQLETAIDLYFHDADPVSVHTLAAAANQIIRDVNEKRGGKPLFSEGDFLRLFKPEVVNKVKSTLRKSQNFFKHAERDWTGTLRFDTRQTEVKLLEACVKYHELSRETVPSFMVFLAWYDIHHPGIFLRPPQQELLIQQWEQGIRELSKVRFYAEALAYFWLPLPQKQGDQQEG
jgi:hypothetical protein